MSPNFSKLIMIKRLLKKHPKFSITLVTDNVDDNI